MSYKCDREVLIMGMPWQIKGHCEMDILIDVMIMDIAKSLCKSST